MNYFIKINIFILILLSVAFILNFKFQIFNSIIYILFVILSFLFSYIIIKKINKKTIFLALLIYIILFTIFEFIYFKFGINIWNEQERVDSSYQWFDVYLSNNGKNNTADLTEGYFKDDNWNITPDLALKQKYDKFFDILQLKPGMIVLDIGCGYCQWIMYLKSKGIDSIGLTLSQNQVDYGKLNGFDVRIQDARNLPESYYNLFDAVTFLGSIEHFPKVYYTNKERKNTYKNMLEKARLALNKNSTSKSILASTINIGNNSKWTKKDYLNAYILERFYSGRYPLENEINSQKGKYLNSYYYSDQTEDYRWMSIINPDHFGFFKIKWTLKKIIFIPFMFLTDPFAIHKWIYHNFNVWMWQFGGNSRIPNRHRYAPCHLKWEAFKLK